jgi:hypothetical protein
MCTHDARELEAITNPAVQAVIYIPPELPAWISELASAVQGGAFRIRRTVLPKASRNAIDDWLEQNLPEAIVTTEIRASLKEDILQNVDRLRALSHASQFMLRIFTDEPTTECGFHVDSVPPGAPAYGFLRVYNGGGTEYVDPANVTSIADFHRYLSRRERLVRESKVARNDGREADHDRLQRDIGVLDEERAFLLHREEIRIAPAGSIVAFKHIDIRYLWSDHSKALAWIHCSPMAGERRLVVNITTPEPAAHITPRARGGIAH